MRAHLSLLLLAACASPVEPPPAQPDDVAATPRPPLVATSCALPGGRTFTADATGITAAGHALTAAPARHLRLADDRLYFFDTQRPALRSLAVDADEPPRAELELPPLEHPGFAVADPLAYLQRPEDLSITAGVLCLDLHDRPGDPTLTYNLRVDLATRTVERRLVEDLTGDRCGVAREAIGPRLCTPAGPSAAATRDGTCVRVDP